MKSVIVMRQANFEIVSVDDKFVTIRDIGPWDRHPSVTNDAEGVVERIVAMNILGDRRLRYYDSEDCLDELVVKDGQFAGFAPL